MKHQIPVWVALSFLMLFLVVFAGFIFTLQTRGQLVTQVQTLEAEAVVAQSDSGVLVAQVTAQAVELAKAEAISNGLSAELATQPDPPLVTPQSLPTITPTPLPADQTPPQVSLITPEDGLIIKPDEEIEILLSVTDNKGIDRVTLTVNNDVIGVYSAENQVLFTVKEAWSTSTGGTYTFVASATNALGFASNTIEATVLVEDRQAALRNLVAEIQGNVEAIRGIEATEPIALTIYTQDELRANFETLFLDELDEATARRDTIELHAFDFIDLDYDLYSALLNLYSDSVLGFYDPDTKELVVVSDDGELTPVEQLTLAHEIDHALQDQRFGLNLDENDSEASFAQRALAEGEATLVQSLYISADYFNDAETEALFEEFNNTPSPDTGNLPDLIVRQQLFPYESGAEFVNGLYQSGGFAAINQAWATPPVSTEQIMHPDHYLVDNPIAVSLPAYTDTLGAGWEQIAEDTLGEFSLQLYLEQEISADSAQTAATGWGGDRYAVHWNEAEQTTALVLLTVWDQAGDDLEFARAFVDYASSKYGQSPQSQPDGARCWQGDDMTCLYQINETTLIVRAPNRTTVLALRGATFIP